MLVSFHNSFKDVEDWEEESDESSGGEVEGEEEVVVGEDGLRVVVRGRREGGEREEVDVDEGEEGEDDV